MALTLKPKPKRKKKAMKKPLLLGLLLGTFLLVALKLPAYVSTPPSIIDLGLAAGPTTIANVLNYNGQSNNLAAVQSGSVISNAGASGPSTNMLPAATIVGMYFSCETPTTQRVAFKANGTDVIAQDASTSAAGGIIFSAGARGQSLLLRVWSTGQWGVVASRGTWTPQ